MSDVGASNTPSGETPPDSGNAIAQLARAATDAKTGKRGPGRPKGSKNTTSAQVSTPKPNDEKAGPPLDPAVIKSALSGLVSALDSIVCRRIENKAAKLVGKIDAIAFANEARMTGEEKTLIVDNGTLLVQQYSALARFAPHVAVSIALASYSWRTYSLNNELTQAIERANNAAKANGAIPAKNSAPSDQNPDGGK